MTLSKGRLLLFALAAIGLVISTSVAQAGKHRALIIGNNYPNLPVDRGRLQNAHGDAESISNLLTAIGFGKGDAGAIIAKTDINWAATHELWQQTLDETEEGGIVVFYFSGHGFQKENSNYLLPEGAPFTPSSNLAVLNGQFISLDQILDAFAQARSKKEIIGLFVVDACREDVFKAEGKRALGAERGFAPVRKSADSETFILFATAPGQYAYDGLPSDGLRTGGSAGSSVFTRNMVDNLKNNLAQIKGEGIADIAQDVRDLVVTLSRANNQSQVPTYYDQLATRRNIFGEALARRSKAEVVAQLQTQIIKWQEVEKKEKVAAAQAPPVLGATARDKEIFADSCPDCPQMVVIPKGNFQQGSPETEKGRALSEGPVRTVTIGADFAIGKSPVTNQQWNICVQDGGCTGPRGFGWIDPPKTAYPWLDRAIADRYRPNNPVTDVSWQDAQAYVAWLSKKTGRAYRLPTESEWEYAARAESAPRADTKGSHRGPYHFSVGGKSDLVEICQYANGADKSLQAFKGSNPFCSDGYGRGVAPVGSYKPNAFRLFDMGGNVWQWVEDCWHEDYRGAPADGSAWTDGKKTCTRVARGGSWRSGPEALRSAARNAFGQYHARVTLGFRVARTLGP